MEDAHVALRTDIEANGVARATAAAAAAAAGPSRKKARLVSPSIPAPVAAAAAAAAAPAAAVAAVVDAAALQVDAPTVGYAGALVRRLAGQWAAYNDEPLNNPRRPARQLTLPPALLHGFASPGPSTKCHTLFWEDEFTPTRADEAVDRVLVCQWCSAVGDSHVCKESDWMVLEGISKCKECGRRK